MFLKLNKQMEETSGLLYFNNLLWTFNDSGGKNELYAIDTLSGNICKTIVIANAPNNDWEDIAQNTEHIFIGDFGNNLGIRTNLCILSIDKKDIDTSKIISNVIAKKITFQFPGAPLAIPADKHNFDCEAMVVTNDSIYLFSKNRLDTKTNLYSLSSKPGNNKVNLLGTFDSQGKITGADLDTFNNKLILTGYTGKHVSFMWIFTNFEGANFFKSKKQKIIFEQDIPNEGICFYTNNEIVVSCETKKEYPAKLYKYCQIFTN